MKSPVKFLFAICFCGLLLNNPNKSYAAVCYPSSCSICACPTKIGDCQSRCICASNSETGSSDKPETTLGHVTEEFSKHREWMVNILFTEKEAGNPPSLLAAMKLMTYQLTVTAMQQVQVIGTFFDAKHQLETQLLFQQMTARAHKDYQPSEGLCDFGTMSRSLAASGRNSDLASKALSKRIIDRQVLAKDTIAETGRDGDKNNRLVDFIKNYCNKSDNRKNLDLLCLKGSPPTKQVNKDINYTSTMDSVLTLDIDYADSASPSVDEAAVMALSNNLFSHTVFPTVTKNKFVRKDGTPSTKGAAGVLMDARAIIAKRSVATNSFNAIAGLKAKGDPGSQPFIYALLKEMGGDAITADDIKKDIGEQPSYYAQMEVLTKKLYQRPEFYSDLYDKPANVMRKDVALQAATLMQKRDLYQSYLRSEMTLAVMLETLLEKEQDSVANNIGGGE